MPYRNIINLEQSMDITRRLTLSACAALALAALALSACAPKPHLTMQQVQSVAGLGMGDVNAKLGRASSITDAGDSVWWEYIDIATANGNNDGSCHIVFRKGIAVNVKC